MHSAPPGADRPVPPDTRRPRPSVRRTRVGGWWVTLVTAALVLLALLIFVLQNGQSVRVSFLGAEGSLPLGIALLLAAIAGVLIVAVPGTGRILQLRHLARRRAVLTPPDPDPDPATTTPDSKDPTPKNVTDETGAGTA
jgi:lipopolysaccharide assembly protein A